MHSNFIKGFFSLTTYNHRTQLNRLELASALSDTGNLRESMFCCCEMFDSIKVKMLNNELKDGYQKDCKNIFFQLQILQGKTIKLTLTKDIAFYSREIIKFLIKNELYSESIKLILSNKNMGNCPKDIFRLGFCALKNEDFRSSADFFSNLFDEYFDNLTVKNLVKLTEKLLEISSKFESGDFKDSLLKRALNCQFKILSSTNEGEKEKVEVAIKKFKEISSMISINGNKKPLIDIESKYDFDDLSSNDELKLKN